MKIDLAMQDVTNLATGRAESDADTVALGRRHAELLRHAVDSVAGGLPQPVGINVVSVPGFVAGEAPAARWPVGQGGYSSPWLAIRPGPSGGTELTLLVSDLRLIADLALSARGAEPSEYALSGQLRPISFACLAEAAERYAELAAVSIPAAPEAIRADCVDRAFAPHLLALFKSAPQAFFAPFDMTVLKEIAALRETTDTFYAALYARLLRRGADALSSGTTDAARWWHGAI